MKKITIIISIATLLFGIACKNNDQTETPLDKEMFTALKQIVNEMDEKIAGVIEASEASAAKAKAIFEAKKNYGKIEIDRNIYYNDRIGILSDHGRKMETNIYVDRKTPLNDYTKWYIQASEKMLPIWKDNLAKYPYLGWQYLTETKWDSLRIFPWVETTMSFGPDVNWKNFGFYLCAKPDSNPMRELRWGRIGSDILGLELLSSISIPIYVDDKFVAISSIDFLITQTFKNYLYKTYPGQNSYIMLINRKTYQIILRNDKNHGDRGWDVMFDYNYLNKLAEEQPDKVELLNKLAADQQGKIEIMIPNRKVVYFQKLKNVDWVAAIVAE